MRATRGAGGAAVGVLHVSLWRSCAAQGGPCAAARLRVWGHGIGVSRGGKRVPRACRCGRGSRLVPPGRERGATHCVCVCATQPGALCGVCSSRGRGWERGGIEGSPHATRRGRSLPPPHPRVCACDRRAGGGRALEPKRCASKRNRKFADGGLPADKKIEQLVFQSQARRKAGRGAGGRASRLGPRVPREARLPHAARARSKREKGGRPKGTDSRGGAPDARPKNPRSSKRHAAPRARAGGHAARSSDCGGEAGGGLGKWGGRWRGRCDVDHWLRAARALASGEERLVPTSSRILFHLSRLMVAVPAANLVGWRAAASSG